MGGWDEEKDSAADDEVSFGGVLAAGWLPELDLEVPPAEADPGGEMRVSGAVDLECESESSKRFLTQEGTLSLSGLTGSVLMTTLSSV